MSGGITLRCSDWLGSRFPWSINGWLRTCRRSFKVCFFIYFYRVGQLSVKVVCYLSLSIRLFHFHLGSIGLDWAVLLLQSLRALFSFAYYGMLIPYRGTGGLVEDWITTIVVMTIVMSKLCF